MNAADLQRYLQTMLGRVLKDAPQIAFPRPIPTEGDPMANWTMDLTSVEMYGYQDLVTVVVEESRAAITLKSD
jgi:hypothetical protein